MEDDVGAEDDQEGDARSVVTNGSLSPYRVSIRMVTLVGVGRFLFPFLLRPYLLRFIFAANAGAFSILHAKLFLPYACNSSASSTCAFEACSRLVGHGRGRNSVHWTLKRDKAERFSSTFKPSQSKFHISVNVFVTLSSFKVEDEQSDAREHQSPRRRQRRTTTHPCVLPLETLVCDRAEKIRAVSYNKWHKQVATLSLNAYFHLIDINTFRSVGDPIK